jgi:hypothetical protein
MAYATEAELLALDGMADEAVTSEIAVTSLEQSEELIDSYCGTSFTYKAFSVRLDGNDQRAISTGVIYIATLTSVTVDDVAAATTGWGLHEDGMVVRDTGSFASNIVGRNVVVEGTAGFSVVAPAQIKNACLLVARQMVLDQVSRIPDGATSVTNEFGNISLAQPGGLWKPTGLPQVNAILNRNRHRAPGAF